jgi:hypothetical protein
MRNMMRVSFGLALFLLVAGIVYATTSREWRGSVMLLVCAVAAAYVGLVLHGAVRRAASPEGPAPETTVEEEAHVGPTIWPFVFSIASLLLVIGIVAQHWVLILGVVLFIGAAGGWFMDIKRQWSPEELMAGAEGSALQHQQPGDQGHRDQD